MGVVVSGSGLARLWPVGEWYIAFSCNEEDGKIMFSVEFIKWEINELACACQPISQEDQYQV